MRQTLRGRYYSYRTEQSYIYWSKQFIFFHDKCHPKDMGAAEIKEYLNYLSLKRRVSASTQNQAFNALLFLYREVLEVDPGKLEGIVRARRPKRIPTVLTMEEVKVLLSAMEGTPQLMARLLYGCGMRLRECVKLRIKDMDWGHSQIIIQDGKGMKSRITLLPDSLNRDFPYEHSFRFHRPQELVRFAQLDHQIRANLQNLPDLKPDRLWGVLLEINCSVR